MMFIYETKRSFSKQQINIITCLIIFLTISTSALSIKNAKYTFNKFTAGNLVSIKNSNNILLTSNLKTKEKLKSETTTESLMRNYAMNLADTKLLKISYNAQNKVRERFRVGSDAQVLTGSVMVSPKGELSFSKDFLEENNTSYLKGRKLIARARYTKSLSQIGWSRLHVETFDNTSAEIQSWAAGYLEGKLSAPEILDFYKFLMSE